MIGLENIFKPGAEQNKDDMHSLLILQFVSYVLSVSGESLVDKILKSKFCEKNHVLGIKKTNIINLFVHTGKMVQCYEQKQK